MRNGKEMAMSWAMRALRRIPREDLFSLAIAIAAIAGLAAAHWIRPLERRADLMTCRAGLGAALLLAGYRLLVRGRLLRVPLLVSASAAALGVGHYILDMARARRTIAETLDAVGMPSKSTGGAGLGPAVIAAAVAAGLALLAAIVAGALARPDPARGARGGGAAQG